MTHQDNAANSTIASTGSADGTTTAAKPARLSVPDLITIGVFTALYFVLVAVATLISTVAFVGFASIFLPAIAALISGCVYMLLATKVGKFGAITVMGAVIGLFLFVSGHFVLSFIASIIFPVIADLIARAGSYRSRTGLLASYVVFSYGLTGPILPLWFMKDAYVASLQARGKDAAYIDGVFSHINMGTFAIAMIAIVVCALIGGWFGQRVLRKHFVKAGIV
ncbi:MptD family putative ECF transporter S component [Bifidobacterium tissieri]|uniref:Trep_Strep domain-containing protein n=1 Tax=Bifidobacterium tissieri TaxID=1630162 RepID=A0A5N0A025_9BIFI|nr:MptD family putative ECF transporter S component [Bifidobacterium tissieri]KAA8831957.1 Trep_Strep domain-containing protein [Bifidobacterium tissieri]KAA8832853.1 Trep_Strep domain-containing protein [Bifidobacterium tissieri]